MRSSEPGQLDVKREVHWLGLTFALAMLVKLPFHGTAQKLSAALLDLCRTFFFFSSSDMFISITRQYCKTEWR